MAGGHHQQIAHAHGLKIIARVCRGFAGKEFEDFVVDAELVLGDCQSHCGRGETLAQRKEHVIVFGVVGIPPAFCNHLAVAHDHQAVHAVDLLVERVHKIQQCG